MEDVYENLNLDIEYDAQNGIVSENYSARAEEIKQDRIAEQSEKTVAKHTEITFSDEDKKQIDIAQSKAVSQLPETKKNAVLAVENVTKDSNSWFSFLKNTAYLYKYSFTNKALIYSQYPNATLCAEAAVWNKLGSNIGDNEKAIPVINSKNGNEYISYLYDISQTNSDYKPWQKELSSERLSEISADVKDKVNEILSASPQNIDEAAIPFIHNSIMLQIIQRCNGKNSLEPKDFSYIDGLSGEEKENFISRIKDVCSTVATDILKDIEQEASQDKMQEAENVQAQEDNALVSEDRQSEAERQSVINYLRRQIEEEKNSLAANALAVIFFEAKDHNKAVEYFGKAISLDDTNTNAVRNLAIALETTKSDYDREQVFNLYDKAAQAEDSIALNNLACCYLNGEGTERNVKKAVECFQKAVKLNDSLAMVNLGDMYSVGNGLKTDSKKAFRFYQMAAEQNNTTALRRLGECYLYGDGTKQDIQKALECLNKSVELGDTKAQKTIELIKDRYMPDKHTRTVTKSQEKSQTEKSKPLDKFRKQAKKMMSKKEKTAADKSKGGEAI